MAKEKSTYRKSQGKGEDPDQKRNLDGLAIKAEKYEFGKATKETDLVNYDRFKLEEIVFLDKYAELKGDKAAIMKDLSLPKKKYENMLEKDRVKKEILEIQKVWRLNRKMTSEQAAAGLIDFIQKMRSDYEKIEDPKDRAKMASPIVKSYDQYLRAAGHYVHGGSDGAEGQIIINIDMGDDAKEVEIKKGKESAKVSKPNNVIEIEGEVKDGEVSGK